LNDKLAWRSKGIAPIITKRRKNRAFSTPHFSLKNEGASHSGGGRKRTEIGAAHGGGSGTGRRAASADLASESGAGARSAARGGEAPLPLGARFGSHCLLGLGGEGEDEEEREAGGRRRGRESSGARRLASVFSCGLANWGWWKRGRLHVHQTARAHTAGSTTAGFAPGTLTKSKILHRYGAVCNPSDLPSRQRK